MTKGFYICTASWAEIVRTEDEPEVKIHIWSSANIFENDEEAHTATLRSAAERWNLDELSAAEVDASVARLELETLEQIVSILKNGDEQRPPDDSILDEGLLT